MKNFNNRLARIETITQPPDPPTIQVVTHHWDGSVQYGPIQPAPEAKWQGLKTLIVEYVVNWRAADGLSGPLYEPLIPNESEETV